MIEELDVVALIHSLPEHGLHAGERGTVVMVYGDHEAYEVEFLEGGDSPYTKALVTLRPADVTFARRATPSVVASS